MSASNLIGLATEWIGLHHHNETCLDLKIFSSGVNLRSVLTDVEDQQGSATYLG